jgi:hypothetical protein
VRSVPNAAQRTPKSRRAFVEHPVTWTGRGKSCRFMRAHSNPFTSLTQEKKTNSFFRPVVP